MAKKKRKRKKGIPGTATRVKGHTRGPRGPNKGMRRKKSSAKRGNVYVRSYKRRQPRRTR